MPSGMQTVIYPAKDLAAAKTLFNALLGEPIMDEPYYVGYRAHGQDIGLDPNGHAKGMSGPVCYWDVEDIETTLQTLLAAGGELGEGAHDVGGGKLVAWVKDADGNAIGLMQTP
jgi:predicted enzyme related to lactoylglutathione lyase